MDLLFNLMHPNFDFMATYAFWSGQFKAYSNNLFPINTKGWVLIIEISNILSVIVNSEDRFGLIIDSHFLMTTGLHITHNNGDGLQVPRPLAFQLDMLQHWPIVANIHSLAYMLHRPFGCELSHPSLPSRHVAQACLVRIVSYLVACAACGPQS